MGCSKVSLAQQCSVLERSARHRNSRHVINLQELDGTDGLAINVINNDNTQIQSVSRAGDVNGDGVADLTIGVPNLGSRRGESYIIFGSANVGDGGTLERSSLNGSNGFVISGVATGDYLGYSVSLE